MNIRKEVRDLMAFGPLPHSNDVEEAWLERWGNTCDAIAAPVTKDEALALMELFGPDGCFGAASSLLHLIETCPSGVPIYSKPSPDANEWVRYLWDRSHREWQ